MKTTRSIGLFAVTASLLAARSVSSLSADEGMWLFNNPPRNQLKEKYGFDATDAWLEHVQKASIRFNSGGSGSCVSEDGLVMSNHHVGADALQKFGDKDRNYLRDGFHARALAEEKRCLDLELNVLMSIEDVTDRVNAAVKTGLPTEEAFAARRAVMAEIEKESLDKTGLRSDVVTLYQGGQYHLYRFKKYTDVRLVFAPEQQIAFFGGDPDNFEFPRYDLDVCFFRAYEDGKPAKIQHYLKWSKSGAVENELIFVPGHPGRTSRLFTVAELEYTRDYRLPAVLEWLYRREVLLSVYSTRSEENARRAKDDLFSVQNSRKAYEGELAGILDPDLMNRKRRAEQKLREAVAVKSELKDCLQAWNRIEEAQKIIQENARMYNAFIRGFDSKLFDIAQALLRAAEERPKPNGERLREFRESARESLELELFSPEPLYDDYETLKLAASLTWLTGELGPTNELLLKALGGQSPRDCAAELIRQTKVKDVAFRKRLYDGGKSAVDAARDPIIELARILDPESRRLRKIMEVQTEAKQQAHALIAKAQFAIEGTGTYPDATFTLRLAYGIVKGYEENGKQLPHETRFAGLYERAAEHQSKPPFDLPPRWLKRKGKLNLDTPLNFVSTADIIGGNSGSPVINRNAELVGLIFDGNIQSLVLDFAFTEKQARAISVCSQAIIEALRKVYDANALADELTGKKRRN